MQLAVLTLIANQFATKDDLKELEQTFKSMDTNGDGILSKDELLDGYTKIYGSRRLAGEEVDRVLEIADSNKNGEIDYSGRGV